MAAKPFKSAAVTATTDVNLDFLTKEEREALLSQKMDMIRQRNKALSERHQMIEADKRQAEEAGQAVKPHDRQPATPAEGMTPKAKGRGRGQPQSQGHPPGHQGQQGKDVQRPFKERPKSTGNFRDANYNEPSMKSMEVKHDPRVRGQGHGGHRPDVERTPKNRKKSYNKEEEAPPPLPHSGSFEYEPIVDMSDLDHRFGRLATSSNHNRPSRPEHQFPLDLKITITNTPSQPHPSSLDKSSQSRSDRPNQSQSQRDRENRGERSGKRKEGGRGRPKSFPNDQPPQSPVYEGRLKGDLGPPPDPSWNPLSDSRRLDKRVTTNDSPGPGSEFRGDQRREQRRHPQNYGGGADLAKVKQIMKTQREKEKEAPPSPRPLEMVMTGRERRSHEEWRRERERCDKERIQRQRDGDGAWRRAWDVDKGEFDDSRDVRHQEPAKRPVGRIGSGRFDRGERDERPLSATLTSGALQLTSPPSSTEPPSSPLSLSPAIEGRGKSRGRGKGRGRGRPTTAINGDKSPRPRTWSGGDDRLVVEAPQKQLLMVQFENTPGDNSVEVEYDGLAPSSPRASPTPPTTPGRGPTGRTPQGGQGGARGKRGKSPMKPQHKAGKKGASDKSSGYSVARTSSSHSQSRADSEDWEDCSGSPGVTGSLKFAGSPGDLDEEEARLMEIRLNPDAPEFLPTSPDFHTTPPSHMKVLAWPSGPHSPSSLSQGSLTSPRPSGVKGSQGSPSSSISSPGSSASQKAMKRREENEKKKEESDCLPDGDQPWQPPPFLLDHVPPNMIGSKKGSSLGKKKKSSTKGKSPGTDGETDISATAVPVTEPAPAIISAPQLPVLDLASHSTDSASTDLSPQKEAKLDPEQSEGEIFGVSEEKPPSIVTSEEDMAGSSNIIKSDAQDTSQLSSGNSDKEVKDMTSEGDKSLLTAEVTSDQFSGAGDPSNSLVNNLESESGTTGGQPDLEGRAQDDKEVKVNCEVQPDLEGRAQDEKEIKVNCEMQPDLEGGVQDDKEVKVNCEAQPDFEGVAQDDIEVKVNCEEQKVADSITSHNNLDSSEVQGQICEDKDEPEAHKGDNEGHLEPHLN